MADEGYPFPGVSQITTANEWEAYFSAVQLDGVVSGLVPSLQSGARTVSVGAGSAYLRGYLKPVSATTATPVPAADSQDRVDRLVLRLDRDAASSDDYIVPAVLTGTAGTSAPPSLTRGATGYWELPICRWTSKADGSLTGLVDERYGPSWFTSAARSQQLVPAAPARTAIESDTGQVYRSDGSTWVSIYQDTGDIPLSVTFPSLWESRSPYQWGRRIGTFVTIEMNLKRTKDTLYTSPSDASEGSQLTTLPAILRPKRELHAPVVLTAGIVARIRYRTDGTVFLQAPSVDVPPGRFVRFVHTFMGA